MISAEIAGGWILAVPALIAACIVGSPAGNRDLPVRRGDDPVWASATDHDGRDADIARGLLPAFCPRVDPGIVEEISL